MSEKKMRLLTIIAGSILWGAMFNPTYIRYILYDAMLEAMQCTNAQLGFLITVYSIGILIVLFPSGFIADKYKPKKIIVVSAIANGLLCFLFAMDMTNYTLAVIVWLLFAITNGGCYSVCAVRMVRIISPEDEQSRNYGLFEGLGGLFAMLGNFLALYLFAKFLDPVAGIRAAMISMGVVCIVGALLLQILFNENKMIVDEPAPEGKGQAEKKEKGETWKALLALLKNPGLYLLTVIIFTIYGMNGAMSYMIPYFTGVFGASAVLGGSLGTFRSYGTRTVGAPFGGIVADKLHSPALLTVICSALIIPLTFGMQSVKPTGSNAVIYAVIFLLLACFVMFMARGVYFSVMNEISVPEKQTGVAISFVTIFGMNMADFILPPQCGAWIDQYGADGYTYIFYLIYGLAAAALVASALIVIINKRKAKQG